MQTRHRYLLLTLMAALAVTPCALGQPANESIEDEQVPKNQAVFIDREAGVIDLVAKMVPVKPQWLELIATTPGPKGREHEAIVTIDSQPSRIHLALVALGLEPGHPQMNRREGDTVVTDPATGPAVELFFVYKRDGETVETPVHEWVVDEKTDEPLPAGRWLFTGSVFKQWQGREYYMADEAGTIASLVNFGDDLIVRQTLTNQDTDFQQLQINEDVTPPYGSDLILRIRVPREAPGDATQTPNEPSESDLSDKQAPAEP